MGIIWNTVFQGSDWMEILVLFSSYRQELTAQQNPCGSVSTALQLGRYETVGCDLGCDNAYLLSI